MEHDRDRTFAASILTAGGSLADAVAALPPFAPPWPALAGQSGWLLWLALPPVPRLGAARTLPVAPELVWEEPSRALAVAAAVALAYARRRGASERAGIDAILRREGPVAIAVPEEVDPSLRGALAEVEGLGVPLLFGPEQVAERLAMVPAFQARALGHAAPIARPHDPALAWQAIQAVEQMGGDALSSYVLHHEGETDGVRTTGDPSGRFAVEVGVRGEGVGLAESAALEASAAAYPGFLDGVTSREDERGHGLVIGWAAGRRPAGDEVGEAIRAWLRGLDGVELVDVRLVFAPETGRSARLTEMRARANAFKQHRAAALRGEPPPGPAVGNTVG